MGLISGRTGKHDVPYFIKADLRIDNLRSDPIRAFKTRCLWKDADSDIPTLKEAKAEYAKVQ